MFLKLVKTSDLLLIFMLAAFIVASLFSPQNFLWPTASWVLILIQIGRSFTLFKHYKKHDDPKSFRFEMISFILFCLTIFLSYFIFQ